MASSAKISVVIPCYNAQQYIAAALRSVFDQAWPDLEVIVVDDGSSDGSAELVARQFPAVKLLRQANQGVAAARNAGIEFARGEWLAFLDADDIWLSGKLRAQWEILLANPEVRMAYTAWQVWASARPEPEPAFLAELLASADDAQRWAGACGWIYPELLLDCAVWTSTVMVHRSLFDEVGTFDPALRIGEDWDLWLRASRVTPIVRVARPYALYRMHPGSITKAPPDTNFKSLVVTRALARWGVAGPDGRCARLADVQRSQARTWSDLAGARLQAGDVIHARSDALAALRHNPRSLQGWSVLAKAVARTVLGTRPARG